MRPPLAPATTLVVGKVLAVDVAPMAGFGFGVGADVTGCVPGLAAGAAPAPGAVVTVAVCLVAGFAAGVVAGAVVVVVGGGAKVGSVLVSTFCATADDAPSAAMSASTGTHTNANRLFCAAFCTVSFLAMIWLCAKEQKALRLAERIRRGANCSLTEETKKPACAGLSVT